MYGLLFVFVTQQHFYLLLLYLFETINIINYNHIYIKQK